MNFDDSKNILVSFDRQCVPIPSLGSNISTFHSGGAKAREVIAAICLVSLVLIPGSAFAYWVPDSYGQGIGPGSGLPGTARQISRRQSRRFTWSSLARKHIVRNIWYCYI
ncbi:MAG: hypothetical protein WBZ36_01565 [Candidatus Nitrosopolaris sp.]